PLNIDVPVIATDLAIQVGEKTYNALIANTKVTEFFNVTQGGTKDIVILTAKTPAADDLTMAVALANNLPTTAAVNTSGVAPVKELVNVT
ncbi:hypothetical protein, partial [Bacillus sp. SIMBA_005]|uniref:hypothetical protein n=1 Tax=Bacillus sp. SIMBA_005 TaxID=3085754 RepID=UPI00397C50C6